MATAKLMKEKLTDSDFDYEQSRAKYYEFINSIEHKPLTRKQYNSTIIRLLKNETDQEFEVYWDNGDKKDKKGEGEPVLIMNRKTLQDEENVSLVGPIVRYLTLENSFDILIKIHRSSYHGGLTEMINFISKKNYITNAIYLEFILLSCNVCAVNGISCFEPESNLDKKIVVGRLGRRGYNRVVELDFLCLERKLYDGNFKFLLIYHDRDTWYTLLRPLLAKCPFEVATELLKIISSFGLPEEFLVLPAKYKFFTEAMEQLSSLGFKSQNIKISPGFTPQSGIILRKFYQWMKMTAQQNWGLGCHIFQWEINNAAPNESQQLLNHKTPYSSVFDGALSELPKKYKEFEHDPFLLDSDVNEAAEIENLIQQTDEISIKSYTMTEVEILEQLDKNTSETELSTEIKLETDIIVSTADNFFEYNIPDVVIKKEPPIENERENVDDESELKQQTPEMLIKDEILIMTENDTEYVNEESNDEIFGK